MNEQRRADQVVRYCPECGLIGAVKRPALTCCPDSFGMSIRRWQAEKLERLLDRLRSGQRLVFVRPDTSGVGGTPAPKPEPAGWRWKYGDTDHHKWVVADSPPPMMVKVFRLEPLFAAGVDAGQAEQEKEGRD